MNNLIQFPKARAESHVETLTVRGPRQAIYIQTKYSKEGEPLVTHPDDQIATTTTFQEDGTLVSERFDFIGGQQVMLMYRHGKLFNKLTLGYQHGSWKDL